MCRLGLWVDVVQFGCFDQRVGNGGSFAAGLRDHKEIILPTNSDGAHCAFRRVVIKFQDAMFEIRPEPRHAGQGIADRDRQWRLTGDVGQLTMQPDFLVIEDRSSLGLTDIDAPIWW